MRWLKFNAVGGIGVGVQLAMLATLKSGMHIEYLLAAALAVEGAVVHNFLWYERFTWADRSAGRGWRRFVRFNLTTGALSIAGNLILMKLLVDVGGLPYLVANGMAIVACSVLNFLVSDRFVFQRKDVQMTLIENKALMKFPTLATRPTCTYIHVRMVTARAGRRRYRNQDWNRAQSVWLCWRSTDQMSSGLFSKG